MHEDRTAAELTPEQQDKSDRIKAELDRRAMERANFISGCVLRTARKRWDCKGDGSSAHRHAMECPRTIEPGDRYVEYLGEADAYSSGTRISLVCARAFYVDPNSDSVGRFEVLSDRGPR